MKKTLAVLIGIAAGAALTTILATSQKGRDVRSNLVKKSNELRRLMANNIEKRARMMHDSDVSYS